jgi:hypothetical protein
MKIKTKKIFEVKEVCKACKGTGIYVGLCENDGIGVVCSVCKGTGCNKFKHEYEEFVSMEERKEVKVVLETNPGICVGVDEKKGLSIVSFGGMPYKKWKEGFPFPEKSEMREYACPCWWYQSADYKKKPDWKECIGVGRFSDCIFFENKGKCWKRWDIENA